MSTIWGLIDDRTGHTGQVLGVIGKLGVPYALKRLEYNALGALLPPALVGASMMQLNKAMSAPLKPPYPPLVIASGRRTLPVLRAIKKASPSTKTIYLMWPEVQQDVDLIVVPQHDDAPDGPNIIKTLGPLHAVTPEALAIARAEWEPQLAHLPRPFIGLVIGGRTKMGDYSAAEWHQLISRASSLVGEGTLLITTSRRTPPEALEIFLPLLHTPYLLHRWDRDKDNPYHGILALADALVVTGDSLSMCAEACVPGVPVFIYASKNVAPPKHQRLHTALYKRGLAHPLDANASLDWKPDAVTNDAEYVASEIRKRFPEAFVVVD